MGIIYLTQQRDAEIGGANALNNFRSAVSKDRRFLPVKRNGQHFGGWRTNRCRRVEMNRQAPTCWPNPPVHLCPLARKEVMGMPRQQPN